MEQLTVVDSFVRQTLINFYNVISQLDLLNPSSEVTELFNELLKFCCSTTLDSSTFERMLEKDFVLKGACEHLCHLRSQYEYCLEMKWAKIYASNLDQSLIEHFSNDGDYHRLIELEISMLQELGIRFSQSSLLNDMSNLLVTKIAFIGSGPIPISSILILRKYAPFGDIYNIDMSHEANQLASIISKRLLPSYLSERMHFITQDIGQKPIPIQVESILKECQVIFLAALVGHDEMTKLNILRNIIQHSRNEAGPETMQHLVIRTTYGLRQVLYPKLSTKLIQTLKAPSSYDKQKNNEKISLTIQKVSLPENATVISSIIAKIIKT